MFTNPSFLLCILLLFARIACASDAYDKAVMVTPPLIPSEWGFDWKYPSLTNRTEFTQCEKCALDAYMTVSAHYMLYQGSGRMKMSEHMRDSVKFLVDGTRKQRGFASLFYDADTDTSFHAVVIEGETLILQRKQNGCHYRLIEIDITALRGHTGDDTTANKN
jgi:hypothetical protein